MNPKRYALWAAGTAVFLQVLSMAVAILFGFDISNAGMFIIPPMAAAMIEGQKWVREHKAMPETSDLWRWSRSGAVILFGVYLILFVLFGMVVPEVRAALSQSAVAGLVVVFLILICAFSILINRWFLGISARSEFARLGK